MNNTLTEEQELVKRLVQDDEQAFCTLYAMYKKRLVYYSMKFIKSPEFAEDIFHDAFTAIWNNRKFIDYTQSFRSYLYTIVRNRILNLIRDIDNEERLKAHIASVFPVSDNSTENDVHRNDLEKLLEKGKDLLTPRQREIMELSRERNMTSEEIARHLNISVKTVNDHISDSLKTLRAYMEQALDYGKGAELLLILLLLNSVM